MWPSIIPVPPIILTYSRSIFPDSQELIINHTFLHLNYGLWTLITLLRELSIMVNHGQIVVNYGQLWSNSRHLRSKEANYGTFRQEWMLLGLWLSQ